MSANWPNCCGMERSRTPDLRSIVVAFIDGELTVCTFSALDQEDCCVWGVVSGLVPPPGTARIIQAETRGVLESEREPRQSRPVCHWCCMPQG